MKPSLAISLIFVFLAFVSCDNDHPEPVRAVDYFPTEIENQWIYSIAVIDSSGNSNLLNCFDTVTLISKTVERDRFFIETDGYRHGVPNRFEVGVNQIYGSGGEVWLDLEAAPGDTIYSINRTSYRERWVMMKDWIEMHGEMMPAMVLKRFRTVFSPDFPFQQNYTLENWYVKGIGIVRYRSKSISSEWMYDMQLVEFNGTN